MGKYRKFIIPTMLVVAFIVCAIFLSIYILSLPLTQLIGEGCSGFSGYHITNCIAYYQRVGGVSVLERYMYVDLGILWVGLCIIAACTFFVFPHISFTRTVQLYILVLGLLSALLLICLPLILFTELIINGCIFALSFVIGFLTFGLALGSSTKKVAVMGEPVSSMP